MEFVKLITVEPVLFLQMVGDTLTYVIYQNLFIDKVGKFNYKITLTAKLPLLPKTLQIIPTHLWFPVSNFPIKFRFAGTN